MGGALFPRSWYTDDDVFVGPIWPSIVSHISLVEELGRDLPALDLSHVAASGNRVAGLEDGVFRTGTAHAVGLSVSCAGTKNEG